MAGNSLTFQIAISGGPTINETSTEYGFPEGGISHGALGYRRFFAQSPWVQGRTLIAAVPETQIGVITFRVLGTLAQQKTRMNTLIAAFTQDTYTVTITIDGQSHVWSDCEPADYVVGSSGQGFLSGPHMMAGQQNITFQVPHTPGWS